MTILAVDDEKLMLENLCNCITKAAPSSELISFRNPSEALEYIENNAVDVAFLDIRMRGMDGLELGKKIKDKYPAANIIFCTGYDDYVLKAVNEVRCNGYLIKPIKAEDIARELENLRTPLHGQGIRKTEVFIQCFGNFEVFINGSPLEFNSAKAKEILAYLVDKKGSFVSNGKIMSDLWEDDADHTSYFKKSRKELYDCLGRAGMEDIIIKAWGSIAIDKNKLTCDYYEWLDGKPEGIKAFNGEYMEQYSWSETTKANIVNSL